MASISFLAVAVIFGVIAYIAYRAVPAIISALAFLLLGLYGYTNYTTIWDMQYCLFWMGLGASIAITVDTIWILIQEQNKENKEDRLAEVEENKDIAFQNRKDNAEELSPQDQLRVKNGLKPSEARQRRKDKKKFGW